MMSAENVFFWEIKFFSHVYRGGEKKNERSVVAIFYRRFSLCVSFELPQKHPELASDLGKRKVVKWNLWKLDEIATAFSQPLVITETKTLCDEKQFSYFCWMKMRYALDGKKKWPQTFVDCTKIFPHTKRHATQPLFRYLIRSDK